MKNFILKNAITVSVILVLFLIIVNSFLIIYNKNEMVKNAAIKVETEGVSNAIRGLLNDVFHNIDLGVRAYGVTKKESMLDPTNEGMKRVEPAFENLNSRLSAQSYPNLQEIETLRKAFIAYVDFNKLMIQEAKQDSSETFRKMLEEDRGLTLYLAYRDIAKKIIAFETEKYNKATIEYEAAQNRNVILQIILLVVSLPTFGFVLFKIRKDELERRNLLTDLEENNRKYIFNPGTDVVAQSPKEVIKSSIESFKEAAFFIKKLSGGDYEMKWDGLNENNKDLNRENLVGELVKMKDNLKLMKSEDEKRLWANEGLSKFSEIVRNNQHDMATLSNETIRFLVNYLNVQQAGLFVLQNEDTQPHLELTAAYAFGRKKFMEKLIEPGQGMVGQAYLEKETILLKEIPNGYTTITSGLGDATPSCLLVVPLKYNEVVVGILEMASFKVFAKHQINFIERAGGFIASAMLNVKTTTKMRSLLEESQQQSEEMRAQEEEMRQNMEEMEATQEELVRKNDEIAKTEAETRVIVDSINATMATVEFTPEGIIQTANSNFTNAMKYSLHEIKGKHHKLVVPQDILNSNEYKTFWSDMAKGESKAGVFRRVSSDGEIVWLNAIYNPVTDSNGDVVKVVKFATNVTLEKEKEQEVQLLLEQFKAQEEEMRQNMEEMEATQEELQHQNLESQKLITEVQTKEIEMKKMAAINQNEKELLAAKIDLLRKWNNFKLEDFANKQKDFSKYKDFQTNGRNILGFINALDEDFKQIALKLLEMSGINEKEFDSEGWYSLESFLKTVNFLIDYFGEQIMYVIGKAMLAKVVLPPHVQTIEQLLIGNNFLFHADHAYKNEPLFDLQNNKFNHEFIIGGHHFSKSDSGVFTTVIDSPYPQEMERGVLTVLCRKLEPFAEVTIDFSKPQRSKGEASTTYLVTW